MGLDNGPRTDTLILFSLNTETHQIKILSIPRDTRVKIKDKYDKINHAMGYPEGEKMSIKTVKELTGLPIHYYFVINTATFCEIVDLFGGIDIEVPQNIRYPGDPARNLDKGFQHLDGIHAEYFVRFRGYPMGDIQRVRTQQYFIKEFLKQKLNFENIDKLPQLYETLRKNIKTNFTAADLIKYIGILKKIDMSQVKMFEVPGDFLTLNHISYYQYDQKKLKEIIDQNFKE